MKSVQSLGRFHSSLRIHMSGLYFRCWRVLLNFLDVVSSAFVSIGVLKESAFSGLRSRLWKWNGKMRGIGRGYQPASLTTKVDEGVGGGVGKRNMNTRIPLLLSMVVMQ